MGLCVGDGPSDDPASAVTGADEHGETRAFGRCAHAYAIERQALVEGGNIGKGPIRLSGMGRLEKQVGPGVSAYMDALVGSYWEGRGGVPVLGWEHISPCKSGHRGLFYQDRCHFPCTGLVVRRQWQVANGGAALQSGA